MYKIEYSILPTKYYTLNTPKTEPKAYLVRSLKTIDRDGGYNLKYGAEMVSTGKNIDL